jgi:hypothetical protein
VLEEWPKRPVLLDIEQFGVPGMGNNEQVSALPGLNGEPGTEIVE